MNCNNCKGVISCGCQKKTASDGKSVCTNCQAKYEKSLRETKNLLNDSSNLTKK